MLLSDLLYYVENSYKLTNLNYNRSQYLYIEIYLHSDDFKSISEQNKYSKNICDYAFISDEHYNPAKTNQFYRTLKINHAYFIFNFGKGITNRDTVEILTEAERIIKDIIE